MSDKAINCAGVIKFLVAQGLTVPTKRLLADLDEIAAACNGMRNFMVRYWVRWMEDHPDWKPGMVPGKRASKETGELKQIREPKFCSYECSEAMYEQAGIRFPQVSACVRSAIRNEVLDALKAKLPYNHEGSAKYRWEGILAYEVAPMCYRSLTIPVHNTAAVLGYDYRTTRKAPSLASYGSMVALSFPLWSKSSGRRVVSPTARLNGSIHRKMFAFDADTGLSRGNVNVVKKVVTGQWKFSCSELVNKDGKWYFHLVYQQPARDLGLDADKAATLVTQSKEDKKPFAVSAGEDRWFAGDGQSLASEFKLAEGRLRALRERHRKNARGQSGHGRGRFYARTRPLTDVKVNLVRRFTQNLVHEVIRFCVRNGCGSLLYREPTMPLRERSWFAGNGVDFDWTRFEAMLRGQCLLYGIELAVDRMGWAEFAASGDVVDGSPVTARVTEVVTVAPHAEAANGTGESANGNGASRSRSVRKTR